MKLYYAPGACSMSPHIVLKEIGKKFEIEEVDLSTKKTKSGADFTKINPKGYVPALEIKKGEILTEAAVIVQYLADKAKATKLVGKAGSATRYKTMEWLNYIATELHKGMGALFNKKLPQETRDAALERLAKRFDHLDKHLAANKFIVGKSFNVADAYAYTILNWAQWVNVDLSKWKNVTAYVARIAARPSVKAVLKAEGLA
jgi:glutathione S-transferase